jgi:DNA-binding response OmpR family regulator
MATKIRTIRRAPEVSTTPEPASVLRTPLPACILIADYDELLLDLIGFKLTAHGYTVLTASDGKAAMTIAIDHRPDLIVLGAMLPVVDGLEVLRHLRKDSRTAQVPVIMLTAARHDREVLAAMALGADDYLVKPFIPDDLVVLITKLLDRHGRSAA